MIVVEILLGEMGLLPTLLVVLELARENRRGGNAGIMGRWL